MKIPLGKPYLNEEEFVEIKKVLQSGWLAHGPKNEELEEKFASYIGTKHAVALNSCTSALHLVLEASNIKGEVIVPSFTFAASANAILLAGAKPVFADCDLKTYNISIEDLERKVSNGTEAVMPVDFAGQACEMDKIMEIAEERDLLVVEDVAEALGSDFNGRKLGSFGIGCFSFYPTKNMTTGEGGMVTTDDEDLARTIKSMRGHGMDKSTWARKFSKYPWERVQRVIGYNFRMTDFQAAMGVVQLKKLEEMNESRRKSARFLTKRLEQHEEIIPPYESPRSKHVYQMYTPRIKGIDRDKFVLALKEKGIGASVHFDPPVHLQPYYMDRFGTDRLDLPNTMEVCKTIFTLPMYVGMSREELEYIVTSIEECLKALK